MNAQIKQLSFDGFGINGGDEYMSRIATLTEHGQKLGLGYVLASAPEMLEALKELVSLCPDLHWAKRKQYEAIISKAEGRA